MAQPGSDIVKWTDAAMFEAQPMLKEEGARVTPRVFLLSATPDPLGAIAAGFRMYAGEPTYDLADITDEERQQYWDESLHTHLKAPWEFVDLHFFIEGVTRAFTHQMVRQRTAVYAQESLRFAVKRGFAAETALPPTVATDENLISIWDKTVRGIEEAYDALINAGVTAEDARGLLPHCVTTRLNYKTNYRNLIDTMGVRLCTQAQFEWRAVALGIMKAVRDYNADYKMGPRASNDRNRIWFSSQWQFQILGRPIAQTFTPICYHVGHCTFTGKLDRGCSIRDRVQAFAEAGVPSDRWGVEGINWAPPMGPIHPEEWMANPYAGITTEYNKRPQEA